jgi:hypothetical protein
MHNLEHYYHELQRTIIRAPDRVYIHKNNEEMHYL